ncbi:ZSCAN29 [Branchiostoma lanceolatum]|uniref:ZSCAN29 protein n=1 Tax=Branchiostoma lanceolatum TaxID=7740 RepID=A0A8J9ZSS9_BRALA|nr:ZSCAN29 [Branchiostoma lanceolatum]
MREEGYPRSSKQIKVKLRGLKAKYRKAKQNNNRSGSARASCPLFEELDAVLWTRPSTNPTYLLETTNQESASSDEDDITPVPVEGPHSPGGFRGAQQQVEQGTQQQVEQGTQQQVEQGTQQQVEQGTQQQVEQGTQQQVEQGTQQQVEQGMQQQVGQHSSPQALPTMHRGFRSPEHIYVGPEVLIQFESWRH